MTAQELKDEIMNSPKPKQWRLGQFVFNFIDTKYGIARMIQFDYKTDCFYDDSQIDDFIKIATDIINIYGL